MNNHNQLIVSTHQFHKREIANPCSSIIGSHASAKSLSEKPWTKIRKVDCSVSQEHNRSQEPQESNLNREISDQTHYYPDLKNAVNHSDSNNAEISKIQLTRTITKWMEREEPGRRRGRFRDLYRGRRRLDRSRRRRGRGEGEGRRSIGSPSPSVESLPPFLISSLF